jgi:hypothetical protein
MTPVARPAPCASAGADGALYRRRWKSATGAASESKGKKTAMTLDARWLRDCAPNEKPGAIVK